MVSRIFCNFFYSLRITYLSHCINDAVENRRSHMRQLKIHCCCRFLCNARWPMLFIRGIIYEKKKERKEKKRLKGFVVSFFWLLPCVHIAMRWLCVSRRKFRVQQSDWRDIHLREIPSGGEMWRANSLAICARGDRGIAEVNTAKERTGEERKRGGGRALYPWLSAIPPRSWRMQLLFSLIAGHDRLACLASRREAKVVSCMRAGYRFSKSSTVGRSIIGFR